MIVKKQILLRRLKNNSYKNIENYFWMDSPYWRIQENTVNALISKKGVLLFINDETYKSHKNLFMNNLNFIFLREQKELNKFYFTKNFKGEIMKMMKKNEPSEEDFNNTSKEYFIYQILSELKIANKNELLDNIELLVVLENKKVYAPIIKEIINDATDIENIKLLLSVLKKEEYVYKLLKNIDINLYKELDWEIIINVANLNSFKIIEHIMINDKNESFLNALSEQFKIGNNKKVLDIMLIMIETITKQDDLVRIVNKVLTNSHRPFKKYILKKIIYNNNFKEIINKDIVSFLNCDCDYDCDYDYDRNCSCNKIEIFKM